MRLGGSSCRLTTTRGLRSVESQREPASPTRRGVLVDRSLARDAIEDLRRLVQFGRGLLQVATGERGVVGLDLSLDQILAGAIACAALEVLADALLGGQ